MRPMILAVLTAFLAVSLATSSAFAKCTLNICAGERAKLLDSRRLYRLKTLPKNKKYADPTDTYAHFLGRPRGSPVQSIEIFRIIDLFQNVNRKAGSTSVPYDGGPLGTHPVGVGFVKANIRWSLPSFRGLNVRYWG